MSATTLRECLQEVIWTGWTGRLVRAKREIAKCELSERQVSALLQLAETWGPATRSRAPAITPIRERLVGLSKDLRRAARELERARSGSATSVTLRETYNRLLLAASDADRQEEFTKAEEALSSLADIVDQAKQALPRQRRHDRADWRMVERIWGALVGNHAERDPTTGELGVFRPFTLHLSSSPGSAFRKICGAMFEEMTGKEGADPERAIKEFIKRRKARRDARSRRTSI